MPVHTCEKDVLPPVLVLAGGFGTRLKGVLDGKPKPLAPVRDRPFLHFLLDDWLASGIQRFIFLLHYKADQIEEFLGAYFSSLMDSEANFSCLIEPEPRGTGGAVKFATTKVNLPKEVIIVNADTWLPGGVRLLLAAKANCIAGVRIADSARFGGLDVEGGRVVGFREKDVRGPACLINGGAYRLRTDLFTDRELPVNFSIETDILTRLANEGDLDVFEASDGFIDIGVPEDYEKFRAWVSGGQNGPL